MTDYKERLEAKMKQEMEELAMHGEATRVPTIRTGIETIYSALSMGRELANRARNVTSMLSGYRRLPDTEMDNPEVVMEPSVVNELQYLGEELRSCLEELGEQLSDMEKTIG